jgi:hypothetical protein
MLYTEAAKESGDKREYISQNFIKLCDIINKNVFLMKKNQVELIDTYAQLIVKVIDSVEYLIVDVEVVSSIINLFLDALKNIAEPNMNKNVIRALTRFLGELSKIPKEVTYRKFEEMLYGVYFYCDHFESSSLPDVKIIFVFFYKYFFVLKIIFNK